MSPSKFGSVFYDYEAKARPLNRIRSPVKGLEVFFRFFGGKAGAVIFYRYARAGAARDDNLCARWRMFDGIFDQIGNRITYRGLFAFEGDWHFFMQ